MYEKTIAKEFRIYQVTATSTPTTIYDLLSPTDKTDFDTLDNVDVAAEAVDGYIINGSTVIAVSRVASGAQEAVAADGLYAVPIYKWPKKVLLSTATTALVTVRVYFG